MHRPALALAGLVVAGVVLRGQPQELRSAEFDRGNRFEGIVGLPISGPPSPGLDLLSFTGFFEAFTGAVQLEVQFFVPDTASQPLIIAQELTQDRFYRMESKGGEWAPNAWATFGPWPTDEVIVPRNVRPANLGVLVRLDDGPEGRAHVAPSFVRRRGVRPELETYRLQLRPVRATLSVVEHTLESIGRDRPQVVATHRSTITRPERRPFRIDLAAATLTEGRYRLTVVGYVLNDSSTTVRREYEFEHRRLPG